MNKLIPAAILAAALAVAGCTGTASTHAHEAPAVVAVTTPPAPPATTPPAPPATTPPAAPKLTPQQKQAIVAAAGYLTDGQGFSEAGLYHQLTSSYGEGFSPRLAHWVLHRINASGAVSWNHQAVLAAKGYMNDGQGFSCSRLVGQLTSSYGDRFTSAQAQHAAKAVGAC